MILFRPSADISDYLRTLERVGKTIGFVPTMGALHAGHISLIETAKKNNDIVICSIFVNPAQFNDRKDLEKYPRPIDKDIVALINSGCDVLFLPDVREIYPEGDHLINYDLGHLENFLEGASRPGHFKGVANVIDRFLQVIPCHRLYLGQKDFQQVKVIQRLIQTIGRKTEVIVCPIMREADGLAMSSRNVRLNNDQRKNASGISKTLFFIRDHYKNHQLKELKEKSIERINQIPEAVVDYLEFCDADSFKIVSSWREANHLVVVTAVKLGDVRLLDNILLD